MTRSSTGNHPRAPFQSLSIRDELERLARLQNPGLARRMARRWQRRRPERRKRARIMPWQDRVLLAVGTLLLTLFAVRSENAAAEEQPWGLQIETGDSAWVQLALDTEVNIDVLGLVARVEVTQRFTNTASQWAEGVYRFPLPEGAAVDRMRVTVGHRVLEGEIQELQTARRRYEKAREAGQTASLVQQQRRNQFETRLANIAPGEAIEVTIGFLHNIAYNDSRYQFRLPLTFTPRWEPGGRPARTAGDGTALYPMLQREPAAGNRLSLTANLVSATDYSTIESQYHDVAIRRTDQGYQVQLLDPEALADRDFLLSWTPALASVPRAHLVTHDDGDAVYAQLMLAPPLSGTVEPRDREVVFVVDTSGSMSGASLTQARAALRHGLNTLAPGDRFNVLQFNDATQALFSEPEAASPVALMEAGQFIDGLDADGGTHMAPALRRALDRPPGSGRMRQVVFITDGAVGNESELLQMVALLLGDSRLFTVSIGSAPNGWFMRKAAEIGRGSHVHVGKPEDVAEAMDRLWRRIRLPALTDICVDWGGPAEYYPEVIPDLYDGEPLWLTARLPSHPSTIRLCGRLGDERWETVVNGFEAVEPASGGDALASLWARRKVTALEDGLVFGADPELTRLEITALALDHGLLTRHTAMFAVDRTPRRYAAEALASTHVPGLLPAGSAMRASGFPPTGTGWAARLLLSSLVLLLATFMLVFSGSRLPMTTRPTGS